MMKDIHENPRLLKLGHRNTPITKGLPKPLVMGIWSWVSWIVVIAFWLLVGQASLAWAWISWKEGARLGILKQRMDEIKLCTWMK
jgi:hypothetical protein